MPKLSQILWFLSNCRTSFLHFQLHSCLSEQDHLHLLFHPLLNHLILNDLLELVVGKIKLLLLLEHCFVGFQIMMVDFFVD